MFKFKSLLAVGLCSLLLAGVGHVSAESAATAKLSARDPHALWHDVDASAIQSRGERWAQPQVARTVSLDYAALQAHLARSPMEGSVAARSSTTTFSLPMPDGGFAEFAIVESPMMEAELGARYPSIRTYAGQGLHDPAATLRLDVTPLGFHAQVLSPRGDFYIDPYQKADNEHYIAYFRKHHSESGSSQRREFAGESPLPAPTRNAGAIERNPVGTSLRTYRLAVATTPSYAMAFGGSKLAAMSGVITTVNRISGIFEREVDVRMVLVANSDALIYTVASPGTFRDPPRSSDFDNYQTTFDSVIGAANYDLGHVFAGFGEEFGFDTLGSVCGSAKAQAFAMRGPPSGGAFDVDLVAHTLAHQLGAIHTSVCGSGTSANVEPGSGSTIMGFAGACGSSDLQPHDDAYLHSYTFDQIVAYTNAGGAGNNNAVCGTVTPTGNNPPNVNVPGNLWVPTRTPFQLTASGSDPDVGDVISYSWEQMGSQFRSFTPTLSPTRLFPSLVHILEHGNVADQVMFPPSERQFDAGETLPDPWNVPAGNYQEYFFRATVRDHRTGGGGVRNAQTKVSAYSSIGPFSVGNIAGPLAGGSSQALTWTVAGTTLQPVYSSLVNILWSQDGGHTFTTLLANTANDGAQTVTMPNIATTRARIRIESANGNGVTPGNTWFDINDANFEITASGSGITIFPAAPIVTRQGSPASAPVTVASIAGGTPPYTAIAEFSPSTPELSIQNLQIAAATVSATAIASCNASGPLAPEYRVHPALLQITDAANRRASAVIPIHVSSNESPTIGTYSNRIVARGHAINVAPSAPPFDASGNIGAISVSPNTLPGGGSLAIDPATGIVTITAGASATLGPLTVRVTVKDGCDATSVQEFVVNVATFAPALQFNGSVVNSGDAVIEPNECNLVNLTLGNVGGAGATAISSTLSSSTPGVTITSPNSGYPDIASGAAAVNSNAFEISTAASVACGSTINLTQTVTHTGPGSPSLFNFALPVGQALQANYAIAVTDGVAPVPGSTLVAGSQADDVVVPITAYPAGFDFRVYGTPVTQLAVSTNGIITFNSATGADSAGNFPLPVAGWTSTATFPAFWDDLDTRATAVAGGGIYTAVSGLAPNRVFDIEWRARRYNSNSGLPPTVVFTVRLHETTNVIEVVYSNVDGNSNTPDTNGAPNGSSATIGIQSAGGAQFTQYSYAVMSLAAGRKLTFTRTEAMCNVGMAMCVDPAVRVFKNSFE